MFLINKKSPKSQILHSLKHGGGKVRISFEFNIYFIIDYFHLTIIEMQIQYDPNKTHIHTIQNSDE